LFTILLFLLFLVNSTLAFMTSILLGNQIRRHSLAQVYVKSSNYNKFQKQNFMDAKATTPPKVQCTGEETTFACFSFALKQPASLILCRANFYTPTAFGFADQRVLRWIKPGQSPVFIPTLSFFLFFWTFGGAVGLPRSSDARKIKSVSA